MADYCRVNEPESSILSRVLEVLSLKGWMPVRPLHHKLEAGLDEVWGERRGPVSLKENTLTEGVKCKSKSTLRVFRARLWGRVTFADADHPIREVVSPDFVTGCSLR